MYDIPVYNEDSGELLGHVKGNKAMYDLLTRSDAQPFTCGTRAPETDPNQQELPLDPSEQN